MASRILCGILWLVMVLLPAAPRSLAQPTNEGNQSNTVDSLAMLRSILAQKQSEKARLERMLNALNTIDSAYKVYYPTWIVVDDDLRERVHKMVRMRSTSVPRDAEIRIIANPDENEILEISVGSALMGRRDARIGLGDSLYTELLSGQYAKRMINTVPQRQRTNLLFGAPPKFAAISMSAFGAAVMFSDGRGIEVSLGREDLGYHFWSTGDFRVMLILHQFKIGAIFPFSYGLAKPDIIGPLSLRPRRLNGVRGFTTEFNQPFQSELLGGRFSIGEINGVTNPDLFTDPARLYFIHTVAQLYYSRQESLGGSEHLLTFTGGVGYHQVGLGELRSDLKVNTLDKEDFVGPLLGAEYLHRGENMYSVAVRYSGSVLHLKGWLEIIKNVVFLDLQYYAPIMRDPRPWEQPYFFMISPRIQIIY
jgi:hypothetical protein